MAATTRTVPMTEGSLGRNLALVALPIALTSLLQQFFNATDLVIAGRFAGTSALAAVGSNTPLINLLVMLMVGVATGANVVISRFLGAGEREQTKKAVHTTVLLGLVCGFLVLGIGECIAGPALEILKVPEDVFPGAMSYLRIYFLGMPVMMLYNFLSAVFRSFGDTRTPLLCLVSAGVLNIILDLVFVAGFQWGVAGVAWATTLSNVLSAGLLLVFQARSTVPEMRLTPAALRMDGAILARTLRLGIPSGLQGMLFSISNIVLQFAINSLGATVMAGSSAGLNLEIFVYYVVNAYGQAVTSFVSQNFGAAQPERCRRVTRIGFLQATSACLAICAVLMLFAFPLLRLFDTDPDVIAVGYTRMQYLIILHFFNGFIELFSGTLRGYGKSMTPAVIAFLGVCVFRIVWVYTYFRCSPTFAHLLLCYPLSWVLTDIAPAIAYVVIIKKLKFAT